MTYPGKIVLVSASGYRPEQDNAFLRDLLAARIALFCAIGVELLVRCKVTTALLPALPIRRSVPHAANPACSRRLAAVAAGRLGAVEGGVSARHQGFQALVGRLLAGDADADRVVRQVTAARREQQCLDA